MNIIRVFPRRTAFTPDDDYCFYDRPGMFVPEHDEIHVVCTFTWDIDKAKRLQKDWQSITNKPVKIGGPALNDPGSEFEPGMYCKTGVTFTSRGCPNNCKFCFVPKREGCIRELEIKPGNIIQDNNFLATSDNHQRKVFEMLKNQRQISFRGGLEPARITDKFVAEIQGLKVSDLWLACDTKNAIKPLENAVMKLQSGGFNQNKIRSYVLIGDDMPENEARLRRVYEIGALPFAQLFQPVERITYSQEWKNFARTWSRPAAYKSVMKGSVINERDR